MSAPIKLRLNPKGTHRILEGHPWVFANELAEVPNADADTALLYHHKGTFLGSGCFNPKSQIVFRRYSRHDEPLDRALLSRKLDEALAFRKRLPRSCTAQRLVWSEADGLPGLIVDEFPPFLVIQTLTLAMANRENEIVELLIEKTGAKGILARNEVAVRKLEGLAQEKKILSGTGPFQTTLECAGVCFHLDLLEGHKTGFYLDQADNYALIASYAKGRRVLDCFSYQGGFSLAALRGGATSCRALDQDGTALLRAKSTAEANGLSLEYVEGNVFDLLRGYERTRESFDLIILDPPSFTRNKAQLESALRGYHELHLRALKMLPPGGLLATFSCSHHAGPDIWNPMILNAASDANVTLRQLETLRQSRDHPILPAVPETSYLVGGLYEKVG